MPHLIKSHVHTYSSIARKPKCSGQPEMIVIGISNITKTQQDHNHIVKSDQNVQADICRPGCGILAADESPLAMDYGG